MKERSFRIIWRSAALRWNELTNIASLGLLIIVLGFFFPFTGKLNSLRGNMGLVYHFYAVHFCNIIIVGKTIQSDHCSYSSVKNDIQ